MVYGLWFMVSLDGGNGKVDGFRFVVWDLGLMGSMAIEVSLGLFRGVGLRDLGLDFEV